MIAEDKNRAAASAQIFSSGSAGVYSGGSSLYDLSFHDALASSFVYGANFPSVYPVLPPEPLLYPALPDFHAALLMFTGWSIRSAFLFTGLPIALATVGLCYCFALRLGRSARAAVIASLLFFFNGGLGFLYAVADGRAKGRSMFASLWMPLANYCNSPAHGLYWVNIIADTLAPQRTTLYALPLAFIVLILFASYWEASLPGRSASRRLLAIAGIVAGLIAYLQPHTLVAIGLVAAALALLRRRREWLIFFAAAGAVALPSAINAVSHASQAGFMRFQPGWFSRDDPRPLLFWLRNAGLPLLLIVPAYFSAAKNWRRFYLAFVAVALVAVLFVVSPNDYDSLKLMFIWYAGTAVVLGMWLARLSWKRVLIPVVALVLVVCCASGFLAIRRGMNERTLMFTNEQTQAADYIRTQTPPRARFLTAPAFHQPALSLAGRTVLRGPTDWLWSHGYDFQEREADVRRIYAGTEDAAELLSYYGIDYVYLGEAERTELRANASFFDQRFPIAYRSPAITIYDSRGARQSPIAVRALRLRLDRDPAALFVDFPRTGFFVYRLYKASFGRMPRRDEFMAAMKILAADVRIDDADLEQHLQTNRKGLLSQWLTAAEFRRVFDGQSNAEFVHAVMQNTGAPSAAGHGDELVQRLNAAAETRQAILLQFVEDVDFARREYNSAFVLIHFFAYLGRNPGDPPDTGLSGFEYWREILDRSRDYRSLSRAFLESAEYKSRAVR